MFKLTSITVYMHKRVYVVLLEPHTLVGVGDTATAKQKFPNSYPFHSKREVFCRIITAYLVRWFKLKTAFS